MAKKMEITKKNIFFGIIIIIILWAGSGLLIHNYISKQGEFGDMFGAINALFSGLALFGIIVSILIQQKELNLQRSELSDTREEFKINRLTNILFKQIEYFNSIIGSENFDGNTIDKFITHLDYYKEHSEEKLNVLIEKNSGETIGLITKVIPLMENFEHLLDESKIQIKEKQQMKRIFSHNINPYFFSLLSYDLNSTRKFDSTDKEINILEKGLRNLTLKKMEYIYKYGRDE